MQFKWQRTGGYEVSTKGDKRFSALNDYSRPIEEWQNLLEDNFDDFAEYLKEEEENNTEV